MKSLFRIDNFINDNPNVDVWVLSHNKIAAKMFWERIEPYLEKEGIKPRLISSRINAIDGLNPSNALILMCGKWWENPVAKTFMESYLNFAKYTIPVDEVPPIKGGEQSSGHR